MTSPLLPLSSGRQITRKIRITLEIETHRSVSLGTQINHFSAHIKEAIRRIDKPGEGIRSYKIINVEVDTNE